MCTLILFFNGWSQTCTYFNTTNPYNDNCNCGSTSFFTYVDACERDGAYFFLGARLTTENRQLAITKLNEQGDTVWNRFYGAAPKVYFALRLFDFYDYMLVVSNVRDTTESSAPSDACFTAFDYDGNFLWEERITHPGNEQLRDVIRLPGGKLTAAGVSHSFGTFNDSDGESYLLQVDSLGNVLWENTFGTGIREEAFGLASITDGFIVNAASRQINGNDDILVYRTDLSGTVLWNTQIGQTNLSENAGKVSVLPDKSILISTAYPFGIITTARLYKLDMNGEIRWQQDYSNATNLTVLDHFIVPLADGTVIVGGGYQDNSGFELSEIIKLDPLGETLFTRYYNPAGSLNNYILNIRQTSDGYILCGNTTGPDFIQRPWAVKTDWMLCDSLLCVSDNAAFEPYDCTEFPVNSLFATGDGSLTYDTGEVVSFENNSDHCTNREWLLGDGSARYSDSLISHTYGVPGDYAVDLITYHGACADTSELTIHIEGELHVSEIERMRESLKLYPNPSDGIFSFSFSGNQPISVLVVDSYGRETTRFENIIAGRAVRCENLAAGAYQFRVYSEGIFITSLGAVILP